MGTGTFRLTALAAAATLGACQPDAPSPDNNVAEMVVNETTEPANVVAVAANAPLRDWIVGAWSFDKVCATDFIIRYDADGKLDNAGDVGTWKLDGDKLTETVTERFENGGEAPEKLNPPITRTYAVERKDATNGVITFQGRPVPILRC